MLVHEELRKLGIRHDTVDLGSVEIGDETSDKQRDQLKRNLLPSGLELLDNKRGILMERIRNVVTELIYSDHTSKVKYSDYISHKLNYDYTYLSNLFSEESGITLQQFIILSKIERAKELLSYDDMNLTQIAFTLHYSSVAHLSNQFKKITSFSPSVYKNLPAGKRCNLENLGIR
jgi:AraC-like DNA-binding protein